MHISKSERCYIAQSLWYYFYMKTNVLQDFHSCIDVLLSDFLTFTQFFQIVKEEDML